MSLRDALTDKRGMPLALSDESGQVGTVVTVVTIGIVAIIGVLIYSQVYQSTFGGLEDTDAANQTQLENSSESVTDGFGSAMQLVPIVLIVLVASLVIVVVQRFGG